MSEQINVIRQAADKAIDSFSIPALVTKKVLHYYLKPWKVIAVTDIILFYEVGYCFDNTGVVDRCVIDEAYLHKHPDQYPKFYTLEELQFALNERKAA